MKVGSHPAPCLVQMRPMPIGWLGVSMVGPSRRGGAMVIEGVVLVSGRYLCQRVLRPSAERYQDAQSTKRPTIAAMMASGRPAHPVDGDEGAGALVLPVGGGLGRRTGVGVRARRARHSTSSSGAPPTETRVIRWSREKSCTPAIRSAPLGTAWPMKHSTGVTGTRSTAAVRWA